MAYAGPLSTIYNCTRPERAPLALTPGDVLVTGEAVLCRLHDPPSFFAAAQAIGSGPALHHPRYAIHSVALSHRLVLAKA
jgi:hypothetical protein